jgi:hypothetical protein
MNTDEKINYINKNIENLAKAVNNLTDTVTILFNDIKLLKEEKKSFINLFKKD